MNLQCIKVTVNAFIKVTVNAIIKITVTAIIKGTDNAIIITPNNNQSIATLPQSPLSIDVAQRCHDD